MSIAWSCHPNRYVLPTYIHTHTFFQTDKREQTNADTYLPTNHAYLPITYLLTAPLRQASELRYRDAIPTHLPTYRPTMPTYLPTYLPTYSQPLCVKLADFGTADLAPETIGRPVGLDQFTTLENTPVDFLTDGDAATQVGR